MEKDNHANEELIELIKGGFDHLSEEIVSVRFDLSSKIDLVRSDLSSKIDLVRTELKNEISVVRTDLSSEISSVRTEISALRSETREGFARVDAQFLTADNNVDKLTQKLQDKNVITNADAKEVMAINPLTL